MLTIDINPALVHIGWTFLRSETIWLWGLQEAQLLAVGLVLLAIVWWRTSHVVRVSASTGTAHA